MKSELRKRAEALAWAIGTMALAMTVDFLATNIGLFNLNTEITMLLGLVLNQISKAIHNQVREVSGTIKPVDSSS